MQNSLCPAIYCIEEKDERKEKKKKKKKIVRFADTGLSGTIKASGSQSGAEQWRWHSFRHVYIKSSISVEPTPVSIRVHFVFANGKADKTFNMFKLASISIIYPIRDYLVRVRGMGGEKSMRMLDLVIFVAEYRRTNVRNWILISFRSSIIKIIMWNVVDKIEELAISLFIHVGCSCFFDNLKKLIKEFYITRAENVGSFV